MRDDSEHIRGRAVVIGILLGLLICAATSYNNAYKHMTPLGGGHFPLAPFFILAWLAVICAGPGKFFRRPLLTGRELLVIWVLMVLESGIAYTGLVRTFFINLTAPFHFATAGNGWEKTLYPLLPEAWYPQSRDAVELFYNGLSGGRHMAWPDILRQIPWDAWAVPLLTWSSFILLCYFVMICMVNLLGPQWVHNERMNFPLLRVPLLMAEAIDGRGIGSFFGNRFLLAGMTIPVCLHLLNGLNFHYPQFPRIPTLILAGSWFPQNGLLSGFQKLRIYIYPAFIGFAFLTSRQISFSFWFFFLVCGLLSGLLSVLGFNIPEAALGITFGPTLSRPEEMQMIGAYGVFFIFILWLARNHLKTVILQSFGKKIRISGEDEWLPLPLAFWGATAGIAGIILWLRYYGMSLIPAVFLTGAAFMVMIVASRIICQGGMAYFTLTAAPIDGLLAFFGPGFFSRAGLLMAVVIQKMLFVDLRESLMPSLFHAGCVGGAARSRKKLFAVIIFILGAGVAVSFISMLALCYKYGARELQMDWAVRTTTAVYENAHTLIISPVRAGNPVIVFSLAGALVMLVLVICYHRFYWWPLHPVGYLAAYSSAMRILWAGFFMGWLFNALCIRYGGTGLYRNLRWFFAGLIVGDFLMGGLWATAGLLSNSGYMVLPD